MTGMENIFFYDTVIGRIGIAENGSCITHIYLSEIVPPSDFSLTETALIKTAFKQLKEYFDGKRRSFDLPLSEEGTDFQKTVWNALKTIPYGETRTYKQIAEQAGNPKACRAVGMANNKNPLPIVVPCHRVIGSNGRLIGYAGGVDVKNKLLDLEKSSSK